MSPILFFIASFFLVVNLIAFSVMFRDKSRSRKDGAERVSEAMLFFLAAAFGSIGVYAGMLFFRHKTRKWQFIVGIPLLIVQNIVFLHRIYAYLA